jgi:hypothetical protein
MGRRLAAAVHVRHPKTHEWLILQPGGEPDEVLAEAITNPDAWEADDEPSDPEPDGDQDLESVPDPEPQPQPAPKPEAVEKSAKPARARIARKALEEQ